MLLNDRSRPLGVLLVSLASLASMVPLAACSSSSSSGDTTASGGSGGSSATSTGGAGTSTGGTGGTGGAAPTDCFDYTTFDGTATTVHFAADVLPILRGSCGLSTSCHGQENNPAKDQHYYGPKLSDPAPTAAQIQEIFDQSVGKPAVNEPSMSVIAAGDPEHSFLMYKLDAPDAKGKGKVDCALLPCAAGDNCGTPMPQGGPDLPLAKRNIIRSWIAQGAKND